MPSTAMLKVNWASASESPNVALMAGMTGKKRWTASGPMNATIPSVRPNDGPGMRGMKCPAANGRRRPCQTRRMPAIAKRLFLELVAGAEHPPHDGEAEREKRQRHCNAHGHAHVGDAEEAPAEAADQVDDRIEQGDGAPERRQHGGGIEAAAKKAQRRDDQQRDHLQLLEPFRPYADDEAEQAEAHGGEQQEGEHPERMVDADRHEQVGRPKDDEPEDDRLGRRR